MKIIEPPLDVPTHLPSEDKVFSTFIKSFCSRLLILSLIFSAVKRFHLSVALSPIRVLNDIGNRAIMSIFDPLRGALYQTTIRYCNGQKSDEKKFWSCIEVVLPFVSVLKGLLEGIF